MYDQLFEEQKATKLRVDNDDREVRIFLNHAGDPMTEVLCILERGPECDSRTKVDCRLRVDRMSECSAIALFRTVEVSGACAAVVMFGLVVTQVQS